MVASVEDPQRVVEVIAHLYGQQTQRHRYGSGLLIGGRFVLTSAHVVQAAAEVVVRRPDKSEMLADLTTALIGDPDPRRLDLAILQVPEAEDLPYFAIARVDRTGAITTFIDGCAAVGYPLFQETERDQSGRSIRETAQVRGYIAPLSGLVEGLLSLEVTNTPARELPAAGTILAESVWAGMSGAAVVAPDGQGGEVVLGVVAEHAPRRGQSSISVLPLDRLIDKRTAPADAPTWWTRLGVSDPEHLLTLRRGMEPAPTMVNPRHSEEGLALLPTDAIPDVAASPGGPPLPYLRNASFVGRDDDLKYVASSFKNGKPPVVVAVSGMGGIGKTQLASEFALRYGQYFSGGVYWIGFGDDGALVPSQLVSCGILMSRGLESDRRLLGPTFDELETAVQLNLVRRAWESSIPRLLIFDNCEEEEHLRKWVPRAGGSRVLLTTRLGSFGPTLGVLMHPLNVLGRNDSVDLLERVIVETQSSRTDLEAIAEELGDLPLALSLAGGYLHVYGTSAHEYLVELRSEPILEHESLEGDGTDELPTEHDRNVGRTFLVSYRQLDSGDAVDSLAIGLLARASRFAPGEPIPRGLLIATLHLPEDDRALNHRAVQALNKLFRLALLKETGAPPDTEISLHRLLALFVKGQVKDEEATSSVETVLLTIANRWNEVQQPLNLVPLQAHLRYIIDSAPGRTDAQMSSLCAALGAHLGQLGMYALQERYLQRAVAINQQLLKPDDPGIADSLIQLGKNLNEQMRFLEAQSAYRQARAIREKTLGSNHPDTVLATLFLAQSLYGQGNFTEARPLFEQALQVGEHALGSEAGNTGTILWDHGHNLVAQGNYAEAEAYYERALRIWQEVWGPEHPETAAGHADIALSLFEQGKLDEAQHHLDKALAIRNRALAEPLAFDLNNPWSGQGIINLAYKLSQLGMYTEAEALFERALTIREQALGADHPSTGAALVDLANNLRAQHKYERATDLLRRAIAIHERTYGPDHPVTKETGAALDEALHAQSIPAT
jgi:tetratricopeptide (TPR) repeat protein